VKIIDIILDLVNTGEEKGSAKKRGQIFAACCPNPRFISAIGIDEIEKFLI